MATIELVIRIPEEDYLALSELSEREKVNELSYDERIIADGIPLPKGHGRLIDANALKETFIKLGIYLKYTEKGFWCVTIKNIKDAPTIIEADKNE